MASYGLPHVPDGVALGDLNGDGRPDLVTTSPSSNSIAVLINRTGIVNAAPVANDDGLNLSADASKTFPASGLGSLTYNDTDIDNTKAELSVIAVSDPAHGTATLNSDGSVTYTPDPGFMGDDSFTYTVSHGDKTATGTVHIKLTNR